MSDVGSIDYYVDPEAQLPRPGDLVEVRSRSGVLLGEIIWPEPGQPVKMSTNRLVDPEAMGVTGPESGHGI